MVFERRHNAVEKSIFLFAKDQFNLQIILQEYYYVSTGALFFLVF